jgi:AAHS family 3-hydroxyphenylpropionic acid transporter
MYAWISLNSLGALLLPRMADRFGRRRIMLLTLIATPVCSLGAAIATRTGWFIVCEVVAYAEIGAAMTSSFVMMAEALPIDERSRGQGIANFAHGLGGALCVILAPLLASFAVSWRWLFVLPGAAVIFVPMMIRALPESQRWERAASAGIAERSRFDDIFGPHYRRRSIPLMVSTSIGEVSGVAVST